MLYLLLQLFLRFKFSKRSNISYLSRWTNDRVEYILSVVTFVAVADDGKKNHSHTKLIQKTRYTGNAILFITIAKNKQ